MRRPCSHPRRGKTAKATICVKKPCAVPLIVAIAPTPCRNRLVRTCCYGNTSEEGGRYRRRRGQTGTRRARLRPSFPRFADPPSHMFSSSPLPQHTPAASNEEWKEKKQHCADSALPLCTVARLLEARPLPHTQKIGRDEALRVSLAFSIARIPAVLACFPFILFPLKRYSVSSRRRVS